jgi:hypothetical protein
MWSSSDDDVTVASLMSRYNTCKWTRTDIIAAKSFAPRPLRHSCSYAVGHSNNVTHSILYISLLPFLSITIVGILYRVKVVSLHILKACRRVEILLHSFLTSTPCGDEWLTLRPYRCLLGRPSVSTWWAPKPIWAFLRRKLYFAPPRFKTQIIQPLA